MGRYIDYFEIQSRDLILIEEYTITITRRGHNIKYDFKKLLNGLSSADVDIDISIDGHLYERQYLCPEELEGFRQNCIDHRDYNLERVARDLFNQ